VLYDINLFYSRYYQDYFATKFLFDYVFADKITLKTFENEYIHPNIGAFQINQDTGKYISDVIRSLFLLWGFDIPEKIIRGTSETIKKKYSVQNDELFQRAIRGGGDLYRKRGNRIFYALMYFIVPPFLLNFVKYFSRKVFHKANH
jgi:hypothetical protein